MFCEMFERGFRGEPEIAGDGQWRHGSPPTRVARVGDQMCLDGLLEDQVERDADPIRKTDQAKGNLKQTGEKIKDTFK
ncbi:MAG: hypothetical protein WCC47_09160 [Pseudonocardiaceae bacterium]